MFVLLKRTNRPTLNRLIRAGRDVEEWVFCCCFELLGIDNPVRIKSTCGVTHSQMHMAVRCWSFYCSINLVLANIWLAVLIQQLHYLLLALPTTHQASPFGRTNALFFTDEPILQNKFALPIRQANGAEYDFYHIVRTPHSLHTENGTHTNATRRTERRKKNQISLYEHFPLVYVIEFCDAHFLLELRRKNLSSQQKNAISIASSQAQPKYGTDGEGRGVW